MQTPTFDFLNVLQILAEHEVDFIVVGGVCAFQVTRRTVSVLVFARVHDEESGKLIQCGRRIALRVVRKRMIHRHTPRLRLALAFLLWAVFATPARCEDPSSMTFNGESRATTMRLAEARKNLDEKKWSQAIEELQAILANAGGDLVPISPSQSVSARRLCQVHLAGLPAEALRLYRQRYENQAGKKLQAALAERDESQLRKLVEDAFCTRAAEKAIDRLGDLAFERGRFEEAEEWWRLLAPLPDTPREPRPPRSQAPPGNVTLVYPDPTLDSARLQAKQLLARLFQCADETWTTALDAYRRTHGKAEGTLAGRKGRYVEMLRTLAEEKKKQGIGDRADWPTFAGDSSRGCVIPASEDILDRLSSLCRDGPTWTFDLQKGTRQDAPDPSPALNAQQARTLAFHPIIVGHQVGVADARYVRVYDVRNGRSQPPWYDAARFNGGVNPNLKLPAPSDLRYTLTAAGDRIYARLGAQDIGPETPPPAPRFGVEPKPRRDNETFLACLRRQADAVDKHFLWDERATNHANAFFEGAPLVAGGQLWIASTRYQTNHCTHAIDCYADGDTLKPPLWRRDVCTLDAKNGEVRYRHHLLTLAGTQIVYCTHDGAVVAIDAASGRTNWAVRYPRRTSDRDEPELKDLAPVLFAAGRLYVAPSDSDSLLCLDPATGRTLWELEPLRVVHLLGVGRGRLIFTTSGGLRGVEAETGNPVWTVPENGGGSSLLDGLTPSGRGLLIGDLVLFPTTRQRDEALPTPSPMVYAIRQYDGRPADAPANLHRLPSGNFAYANGILVVADRRTLSIFVPPRLLLGERRSAARRDPDSAKALLDLARAEADAGKNEEALRTFRRIEERLRRNTKSVAKKMLEKSHRAEQHLLLKMARRAAENKSWEDAENALERAAALPLPPRYRLHALLSAAQIWQEAKQTERANAVWKSIRTNESLHFIPGIDRQGRPVSVAPRFAATGRKARGSALPFGSRREEIPSLPLYRSWHVALEKDEWMLTSKSDLLLSGAADGRISYRQSTTGAIRWTRRLSFAPRWAAIAGDVFVVGGDQGVAGLRQDDGKVVWHFPAPESGHYPRAPLDSVRVVLDPRPLESLTAFRLKGGRVFFLQGRRRLFALNAESGAVLWDRWAPDAALSLPYPRGCFSSHYHAGPKTVLVQSSRRRWLLDAASGRQIHEAADDRELWRHPPLELDEHTLCVLPDNRHLQLIDAKTGQTLWTYRPPQGTTLSGEMSSALGRGEVLLYLQPLNIGYSLQRLDRASGKPMWSRPSLLAAKSLDRSAWSFDAEAVYGIEDEALTARSLTDGEIIWRRPLYGFAHWQTQRIGTYLAVSPLGAIEWKWRALLGREVLCPLSCYDAKTGQPVQRFHFRLESPSLGLRFWDENKTNEYNPIVHLDSSRPFVAAGGEVWGLTAKEDR